MKLNKKLLNIPIVLMIVIAVLCLLNVPSRINMLNGISGAEKIGIITITYNEKEQKHENGEEVLVTKKQKLFKIINTINNGKIDTEITPKRPQANYELKFYKDGKTIKAYYWQNQKYNMHVEGVEGEIAVDNKLEQVIKNMIQENSN
ncbi:hypothetical protein AN1V17_21910 [Vallitalea sediminicola]